MKRIPGIKIVTSMGRYVSLQLKTKTSYLEKIVLNLRWLYEWSFYSYAFFILKDEPLISSGRDSELHCDVKGIPELQDRYILYYLNKSE